MLRTWKTVTVWGMTLLTAATPASACRGRFWGGQPCYSSYSSYSSNCYVQCAPVNSCCGEGYSQSDCGPSSPAPTGTFTPAPTDHYPQAPNLAPSPAQPAPSYRPAPSPAPARPIPADELPPVEPPSASPIPSEIPPAAPPAPDMPESVPSPLDETPAPEPETPAPPASDVEDLFKETETDKTPAADPAEAPATPGGDVEDLFKETDEKKAASSEPAPPEPMEPAAPSEVEELFSEPGDKAGQSVSNESAPAPAVIPEPVAPAEIPLRLWTDNTGKHQVWGRLVTVTATHVRLLKETGKHTTVPFERLSRSDLAFVRNQAPSSILAGKF
jgi:hypothetical protein